MRSVQEKARLRQSFNRGSLHNSIALKIVCASQISRSFASCFGTVAYAAGFFSIRSHFMACVNALRSTL